MSIVAISLEQKQVTATRATPRMGNEWTSTPLLTNLPIKTSRESRWRAVRTWRYMGGRGTAEW